MTSRLEAALEDSGETSYWVAIAEKLERLRRAVEAHGFWYGETRLHVTITIGMAPYASGQSAIEWANAADRHLYAGKANGKNQLVY